MKHHLKRRLLGAVGTGLFTLLSLFMIWFGYVYLTVEKMLWFHAAAIPEALQPQVLPLYLALMNLVGGSSIAFGAVAGYVTWAVLPRAGVWPNLALTAAFVFTFAVAAVTAEDLAAATGAPTSWHIMGVLIALAVSACAARVGARLSSKAPANGARMSPTSRA